MPPITKNTSQKAKNTPLGMCVIPLLEALKWHGTPRQLYESLPHVSSIYSIQMFQDVLEHLHYESDTIKADLLTLDERLLPSLFVSDEGHSFVLLEKKKRKLLIYDPNIQNKRELPLDKKSTDMTGTLVLFRKTSAIDKKLKIKKTWLSQSIAENKKLIYIGLWLSFFMSLLALATPLFIMSTYNKVIGASSVSMLSEFVIGVTAAYIGYYLLFRIRAKILAIIGARLDRTIGNIIFQRLLYLTPAYTETATVGAQISRIKDFDRLRQFITSPAITVFFDMPFIFVALSVIAILGGMLVLVPVTLIVIFIILGLIIRFKVAQRIKESGRIASKEQEFILESVKGISAIKYLTAIDIWKKRFRDYSAASSMANVNLTMLTATASALADILMIGSGLAILAFGAVMIMNQTLTIGGMIASLILIWRVLAPLKTLFNIIPRLQQIESSIQQINRLMEIEPETPPADTFTYATRQAHGDIVFENVSLRYQAGYAPALLNINFHLKPGEMLGVVGRNGSGKSSLLRVLLGLYRPQAGSIRVDNQDIRQINAIQLRNMMAYAPQYPELFRGTVAKNLRFAKPDATDQELRLAATAAGILEEIMALPKGFDTLLKNFDYSNLSENFQQSMCLARAYLKRAHILLLDEPSDLLSETTEQQLITTLKRLHHKVSIILISHNRKELELTDKILMIEQGQVLLYGATSNVLSKIPKEML